MTDTGGPADATAAYAGAFVVVVPVKPPAVGKSRLGAPAVRRRELAGAFALDTVTAALAAAPVEQVLVVTDDALFSRDLVALGASSLPDGDTSDLNATLRQAVAEAHRRWPDLRPAALCSDLPALLSDELTTALRAVSGDGAAFVADAAGTGTTLYTAPAAGFAPRFGVGSRGAHLATGATEIAGDLPTLRCDVDDLQDLQAALRLGVGTHTVRAAEAWGETASPHA